jgi:hypothetical protein
MADAGTALQPGGRTEARVPLGYNAMAYVLEGAAVEVDEAGTLAPLHHDVFFGRASTPNPFVVLFSFLFLSVVV